MIPTKPGDIVRYHTPFPDEDPAQLYCVLQIFPDANPGRTHILALNTGLNFPPICVRLINELETALDLDQEEINRLAASIKKYRW